VIWIDIQKKLPPKGVRVLTAKYDGRDKVKMYFVNILTRIEGEYDWRDESEEFCESKYGTVTHWMFLPDAPHLSIQNE
jgi:hypothetical protein